MKGPDVIKAWEEITGEKWRLVPYIVTSQASEFASAGFTKEDLKLVVTYTRKMIAREEGGFNAQSATWRVLAADNWQKFQERLAAAQKTRLARMIYGQADTARPAPSPTPTVSPADAERIAAEARAEAARFRESMKGGGE